MPRLQAPFFVENAGRVTWSRSMFSRQDTAQAIGQQDFISMFVNLAAVCLSIGLHSFVIHFVSSVCLLRGEGGGRGFPIVVKRTEMLVRLLLGRLP